jgi:3-deoxy-D-manno-octulosonic-acid transferase
MRRSLERSLYTTLLYAALPFLPLRLWWRGRNEPGYRAHWGERFGRYSAPFARTERPILWVHAVSLGETRAAQPLVRALAERYPDHQLLITHMTATGRIAGEELFPDALIAFLPYDYPFAVEAFFARFRPRVGILMETEVWPNLIRAARRRLIPIVLANARLSARSARGYARVPDLAREAFGGLSAVGAQSEADAARLARVGAASVAITGNVKFDMEPPASAAVLATQFREWFGARPVLLAASTRDGEEALILDALARHPLVGALVVIVPRHPQRFDAVAALLRARSIGFVRRSDATRVPNNIDIVLGDSMGEMGAYYRAADLAFIGGSLLPFGAQNLIEACVAGTPVLIGPSSFNFAQAAELAIEARAAHRVETADDLIAVAQQLLADRAQRKTMGRRGQEFANAHRGATARTLDLIASTL